MMFERTAVALADGGSSSGLPTAREFITSAGFGGALALLAALVIALVVLVAARRAAVRHRTEVEERRLHDEQVQATRERAAEITVCEQRFRWIVETAGFEPAASENATLGLGPELALELLSGLLADAHRLGDETLAKGIAVYLNQFSLVLAQQGGPLAALKADTDSGGVHDMSTSGEGTASNAAPPSTPARTRSRAAAKKTESATDGQDSAAQPAAYNAETTATTTTPGRRRRQ